MKARVLPVVAMLCLLVASVAAKNYKGAELRTRESFLYGRFEARYKASAGDGHVSTFFTYNDIDPTANWNEIDIEIHGRYTDDVQVTTITPRQMIHLRHQWVPFNTHVDFHVYAFEWTPDYVA
ncbi:MAG: family 16 glycosylhydrolase, partial [candidate division KSB1 bacterium]|nr:family 16 glycosylhydrolase [candidate division KSB1 bacterium]